MARQDTMEKDYGHRPVLLHECMEALAIRPEGVYVDGTLGRGGHSLAIAQRLTTGRLIALDRDETALAAAEERLAASEAVCRYLAVYNCIAVVATHDPELAESMRGLYDCYHFKSEIRGSDICFDYKIYRGLGVNRNAVRILAYMGFPGEIVEMAERLCGPDGGGDQPAEFQTGK